MEEQENGYTLIEVLITVVIMGFILLVVNVVMIAIIRISYDTDARIKVRQGLEFSLEVMRRNVKSSDPGMIEIIGWPVDVPTGDALWLQIPESEETVTFYLEPDPVTNNGVLIAEWQGTAGTRTVFLTSPQDINVESFTISINPDPTSGTSEIVLTVLASSVQLRTPTQPLVDNVTKQATIITRYRDL